MVPVVDQSDGCLKQRLQVFDIHHLLVWQLLDEPSFQGSVISLDLSLSGWIAGFYPVSMNTQKGKTGAEDHRVVSRGAIKLHTKRDPPLGCGQAKNPNGRLDIFSGCDDGGQNVTAKIIENRQHVNPDCLAVDQRHRERAFGVQLPNLVRLIGLV